MRGKTALITGASAGIGWELAFLHAKSGGDIVAVARREERLEQLKTELESKYQVKVYVLVKDLSEAGAASDIYSEIKSAGITVDYLINNAGFGGLGRFSERDMQKDIDMIKVNVIALTELTRLFVPDFIDKNEGRILNVSSIASLMPGPVQAVYYATKAYVTSLSNALAEELHDTGVTVTTLLPGPTETEFGKVSGMQKTKAFIHKSTAESVARDGYRGMLKGRLNVVSVSSFPQRLLTMLVPLIPRKIMLRQVRKLQESKIE
jgi:short-subunit dehydrogenase